MRHIHSLRWRLIVSIVLGMSAVLGIGGWIAYRTIAAELYDEFDRGLSARAGSVISMIETKWGFPEFEWAESGAIHPPGYEEGHEVFQLWSAGGIAMIKTPVLGDDDLPAETGLMDSPFFGAITVPAGGQWRGIGVSFTAAIDSDEDEDDAQEDEAERAKFKTKAIADLTADGWLRLEEPAGMKMVLARSDTVQPALANIRRLFFWLWLIASVTASVIIWILVKQNLRPLDALRSQIGNLQSGDSDMKVNLENPPVELAPAVDELNRLLERLDNALLRERNLTSNVAHELRTPIAGLLSTLEVTLSRPRDSDEYREAGEDCLEIAKRMHWLVNNLLSIARVEAGNVELRDHIVELKASLQEWWLAFEGQADANGLKVVWEIPEQARLETDPEFLRVVVSNLFDNAVSYTATGGTIVIRASEDGCITVGNDVVDFSPEAVQQVFEPFWRSAESREDTGAHAGLGLSLCQKIVRILGGEINVALPHAGKHFEVRLQFAR